MSMHLVDFSLGTCVFCMIIKIKRVSLMLRNWWMFLKLVLKCPYFNVRHIISLEDSEGCDGRVGKKRG